MPGMQGQSSCWCQECKVGAVTGARNARSEQPLVPGMQGQSGVTSGLWESAGKLSRTVWGKLSRCGEGRGNGDEEENDSDDDNTTMTTMLTTILLLLLLLLLSSSSSSSSSSSFSSSSAFDVIVALTRSSLP